VRTLYYPIRVPSGVLQDLGKFTGHFWSDTLALEPFICEAIHNYKHPALAAPAQATPASEAGYQWKQVFLPHGTRRRASGNRNAWKAVWLRLLDGTPPAARHRANARQLTFLHRPPCLTAAVGRRAAEKDFEARAAR